jgi:hypothetical protein
LGHNPVKVCHGLEGGKNPAADAGPAFIDAVKFPVTKIALDIAAGSNRQVDSSETLTGIWIKTGVIFNIHFFYPYFYI